MLLQPVITIDPGELQLCMYINIYIYILYVIFTHIGTNCRDKYN